MKKFEIFPELPKRDTKTQSEKMLLEKWQQQTCSMQVASDLLFVKDATPTKCNGTRHACTDRPAQNYFLTTYGDFRAQTEDKSQI